MNHTAHAAGVELYLNTCISHTGEVSSPHLCAGSHVPLHVCVGVSPHLCLLIGRVVAHAAVQREGATLPLAVFRHVTLEKSSTVRLKAAHVTPGGTGR